MSRAQRGRVGPQTHTQTHQKHKTHHNWLGDSGSRATMTARDSLSLHKDVSLEMANIQIAFVWLHSISVQLTTNDKSTTTTSAGRTIYFYICSTATDIWAKATHSSSPIANKTTKITWTLGGTTTIIKANRRGKTNRTNDSPGSSSVVVRWTLLVTLLCCCVTQWFIILLVCCANFVDSPATRLLA